MLLALAMGTSVFAATNPVTFGLSEYRRETNGKQYGYRINNGNKKVWKVIVYENDGTTMNFDNTIYCLKAEKGFYTATPNSFKQTYDKMVDFADKASLVPAIFENDDYYYAATWILDHAYIPYYAKSGDSELESISQFFHILGSVDQQRGCCEVADGKYEITLYTSCCNASKGIYYYTTYENHQITAVDPVSYTHLTLPTT